MSCGVEIAAPGALAPLFWIAITRVAAAGGAIAHKEEVDSAKVGCCVAAAAMGAVVSSGHDAPPVSVLVGGRAPSRSAVGPINQRFLDEVARAGFGRSGLGKMFGDA